MLVVDTSSTIGQLVLWSKGAYIGHRLEGMRHGEQLLDSMRNLLRRAGIELKQLDAIAVVNGPGSLTGIRLSCAVVQALAWTYNLPVVPLNSLLMLGWHKLCTTDGVLLMDARMEHVYITSFCRGNWQGTEIAARHMPLNMVQTFLRRYSEQPKSFVNYYGNQDTLARLHETGVSAEAVRPSLSSLAEYAMVKWCAGGSIPVASLEPNYLALWAAQGHGQAIKHDHSS